VPDLREGWERTYAGDVDEGREVVDEGGYVCVGLLQKRLLLLRRRRGTRARGGASAAAGLAHRGGGALQLAGWTGERGRRRDQLILAQNKMSSDRAVFWAGKT
jgi:hypothetical protein